jgi:hypothetical protein
LREKKVNLHFSSEERKGRTVMREHIVDNLPTRPLERFVSPEALQSPLDRHEDLLVELRDGDMDVEHGLADLGGEVVEACRGKEG